MDKLKTAKGDWVVVCDGTKALILENVGDATFPNLRAREVKEHQAPATHDQKRSARSHPARPRSVPQRCRAVSGGQTRHIVVVAPPRALGVLRQAYPGHVRSAIRAEVAHDYVKLPVGEIEKRLFG